MFDADYPFPAPIHHAGLAEHNGAASKLSRAGAPWIDILVPLPLRKYSLRKCLQMQASRQIKGCRRGRPPPLRVFPTWNPTCSVPALLAQLPTHKSFIVIDRSYQSCGSTLFIPDQESRSSFSKLKTFTKGQFGSLISLRPFLF